MAAQRKQQVEDTTKANEKKWGKNLFRAGWTVIPSVIIERQKALGLDPVDMNIILHLAKYWWTKENLPRPAKDTIAQAIGKTARTVQRRITRLENDGILKRVERRNPDGGQLANAYSLAGLIKAADAFAVEALESREERAAESKKRKERKRPRLKLVKDDA